MGFKSIRLACLIGFISVPVFALEPTLVVNSTNSPVNVTGSVTCTNCSAGGSSSTSSTFTVVNQSTVTFNGVAQPVYQVLQPTVTINGTIATVLTNLLTTTYVTNPTTTTVNGIVRVNLTTLITTTYVVNNSTTQVSNFPALQAVSLPGLVTTSYIVNNSTVQVNNFPSGFNVNNNPIVLISSQGVNASTMAAAQIGSWTVSPGTGTYTVVVQNFPTTQGVSFIIPTTTYVTNNTTTTTTQSGTWTVSPGTGIYTDVILNTPSFKTGPQFLGVDFSTGVLITPPTLTKGTQGATGLSVQRLQDAGRTHITYYVAASTTGATTVESILQFTKSAGTSATSTAEAFVITSGKTFHIENITIATRANAVATAQTTTFNLRLATAGGCITSSTPIIWSARSATAATSSAWDRFPQDFPEGLEIAGNGVVQFCASVNSTFVTNAPTADMLISGYEY